MRTTLAAALLFGLADIAYGQPQTTTLSIPPSAVFSYVAATHCDKSVDAKKQTCEGKTVNPDSVFRTVTFKIAVVSHADGATVTVTSDKVAVARETLAAVSDAVNANLMFARFGRDEALTEAQTRTAIEWAKTHASLADSLPSLGTYEEMESSVGGVATVTKSYGTVLTPTARIIMRNASAAKEYKPLAFDALTNEERAPETWIIAEPYDLGNFAPLAGRFANVTTVALLPSGSRDPSSAIAAAWSRKNDTRLGNAFGATIDTRGMTVAFKTSDLVVGRDVVVVYEGRDEVRLPITEALLLTWRLLVPAK